jgi:hypothetical protein
VKNMSMLVWKNKIQSIIFTLRRMARKLEHRLSTAPPKVSKSPSGWSAGMLIDAESNSANRPSQLNQDLIGKE